MKLYFPSRDEIKNFYTNYQSRISLLGALFLLIITVIATPFITQYSQTFLNYAASPSQNPAPTQPVAPPKPTVTDITQLQKYLTVEAALLGVSDSISLYFEDLNQHKEITIDPTRSWIPASTVKAYVALEAFRQRRVGLIDFNQTVTIQAQNVVPTELETDEFPMLREGTQATIKQLVEAMIIQSDNTAYNTLLDTLDRRSINATLRNLGFTETVVGEKLNLDDGQFQQDLTVPGRQPNTTTAKDLGYLFDLLYTKQIPDSDEILSIFKRQKINTMLPALIPETTAIAHKTGDWAPIYHDGGVIYKPGTPFVLVIFSNSNDPNIVAELAHVAYYQNADSVGQNLNRDKAMLPAQHFITSASLTNFTINNHVLGAKTSNIGPQTYIVQPGDSLYSIAQKFYGDGERWPDIARRNYLSSPTDVDPGQTIIVPSVKISQSDTSQLSPIVTAADLGITTADLTVDSTDAENVNNAKIVPGSSFYPIKYIFDQIRIAGSITPAQKFDAYLAFATSRLAEIKTLMSQGNTSNIQILLNESEDALTKATSLAKNGGVSQEGLTHLKQLNDLHFAILAQNISHVSSQDKEGMIDTIYNFYQKTQHDVAPTIKSSVANNPVQQEPTIGVIKKIENNTATVTFDNGDTKTVTINETTTMRNFQNKSPDTSNQLQEGEKIAIIGNTTKDNEILPTFILHNIPKNLPDKHEGTIIRTFPQSNKLEIINTEGKKEEVHIDNNTVVRSKDTSVSIDGITPGSKVTVFGEEKTINTSVPITNTPTQQPTKTQTQQPTPVITQMPNKISANQSTKTQTQQPTPVPTQMPNKISTQQPTPVPTQMPNKVNPTNNGGNKTSDTTHTNQTTVIHATSITVTQNGSGKNTQIVTQPTSSHPSPSSNNNSPAPVSNNNTTSGNNKTPIKK